MRRERDVDGAHALPAALVERAPDWLWTADADGTRDVLQRGAKLCSPGRRRKARVAPRLGRGRAGPSARERTVDTRSVRTDEGWLGIDRDLTEAVPAPRVAVVRRPVVDGRREVVGYELVGDGSVLAAFPPDELVALAAGGRCG